jgi:gamma-glutamyltranspeptidase/glutathione hydrolase
MDGHGNAVSWVQSLFEELGSGIVSESTGIVLHNRLWLEKLAPGHPNTLAPGRRPFHTLCPALLVRGGRCALAIATPGDHGQPQTLAQVIVNLEDRGMDIQRAIESPRLRHDRGAELMVESRFPAPCLERLARSGYALRDVGPWARPMGGVNAIHQDEDGIRMGGADPRRASYAIAE